MRLVRWFASSLILLVTASAPPVHAQDTVRGALAKLGDARSIEYSGKGTSGFFGQAILAGKEWPLRELSSFSRAINYEQRSAREELTFAQPTFGGQQQNTQVNADKAWNVGPNGPVPQPAAADERQLSIWLSPHGFLKAALAARDATTTSVGDGKVVSFKALGKYNVRGTIDARGFVTEVSTSIPTPVLGDTALVAIYSSYRDFGGVMFPAKIVVTEGGFPLWVLDISSVKANAPLDLPVPDSVASAAAPAPPPAVSSQLAQGVWFVDGGSHHSVIVEFDSYVAVVEAPIDEQRSLTVLNEAKRLIPSKPVRYVLTTHHHFDHVGGLRTYVAQGVTVVTHASNVEYFRQTLAAPATLNPDLQARNRRTPTVTGVADKYRLSDGKQTIEVYATTGDTHTGEYTLIYLPGPKILIEGDPFSPGPPGAAPPATPPPNAVVLYDAVQRLRLEVSTIAPIHGRGPVAFAEFLAFVGRK